MTHEEDLRRLLNDAATEIPARGAPIAELVREGRRSKKRRHIVLTACVAAAVAVIAVGGFILGPSVGGSGNMATQPTTTAPTSSTTPAASAPVVPDTDPATQPVWDPLSIEEAPLRPTKLPERIDLQTAQGPTLKEQPMSGIVAALRDDKSLRLLDTDGTWRIVSLASGQDVPFGVDDVARPSISSDSTRVAVPTEAGIRVIDGTTSTELTIPWPERFRTTPYRLPNVEWQPGDDGFIVFDTSRTWLVGLDGSSREAPYRSYALGIDPDGPVYQNDFEVNTLVTWEGNQVVDESPFIQCERIVAGYGRVACTTGSLQPSRSGPVVLDPMTGEVLAYAPIKDPHAIYSDNGGLTLLGFLDENTLLMLVGPAAFHGNDVAEERFLASWQFRTGEFQRISTGDAHMRSMTVAPMLVD